MHRHMRILCDGYTVKTQKYVHLDVNTKKQLATPKLF